MLKYKIIIFLTLGTSLNAQTTIPAGNVSGTWTKSGSPYKVNGNIVVQAGQTLTIEKGVNVEFQGAYDLVVLGKISAIGSVNDSIRFYPKDTNARWLGIRVRKRAANDSFYFKYCRFSYSGNGSRMYNAALRIDTGNFINIYHCHFDNNEGGIGGSALSASSSATGKLNVVGCYFYKNHAYNKISSFTSGNGPSACGFEGNYYVDSCSFINCVTFNKYNLNNSQLTGDIGVCGLSGKGTSSIIKNCLFLSNHAATCAGLSVYPSNGANHTIKNCRFESNTGNTTAPVFLDGSNGATNYKVIVDSCVFLKNKNKRRADGDYGAAIAAGNVPAGGLFIKNCKFYENDGYTTVEFGSAGTCIVNMDRCLFYNNKGFAYSSTGSGAANILTNSILVNNYCGINTYSGSLLAVNNIIAYNGKTAGDGTTLDRFTANQYAGGVFNSATMYFYNNIVWGNKDSLGNTRNYLSSTKYSYWKNNIIGGDSAGIIWITQGGSTKGLLQNVKTLNKDPLFVNPSAGVGVAFDGGSADWHLQNTCNSLSPAWNAGEAIGNATLGFVNDKDYEFNPRISQKTIDLGPYEFLYAKSKVLKDTAPADFTNICTGVAVNFNSTFLSGPVNYQWQKSINGTSWTNIPSSNSQRLNILNPSVKTWYRCIASSTECAASDTSLPATSIPLPAPAPNLGADQSIPNNGNKVLNPGTFNTYLWSTGANTSTLTVSKTNLNVGANTIWVTVTGSNGCKASDTVMITLQGGVGVQNPATAGIQIYPVPMQNELNITLPDNFVGQVQYQISNLEGKLIKQGAVESATKIDVSMLSAGTYFVIINAEGTNYGLKIVK